MNIEILLLITLSFVGIIELVLAYRVWKLERQMLKTIQHFIDAKNFLGEIKETMKQYQPAIQQLAINGVKIKGKNERLGEFDLELKPSTLAKHIPFDQIKKQYERK